MTGTGRRVRRPFQSTHPRGVRLFVACRFSAAQYFNPRTRVGCDVLPDHMQMELIPISIHAPAWGATSSLRSSLLISRYFNPRTRVGCDMDMFDLEIDNDLFQSTHPRGVRRLKIQRLIAIKLFQSTHPRGVRLEKRSDVSRMRIISIHAPAWGAT